MLFRGSPLPTGGRHFDSELPTFFAFTPDGFGSAGGRDAEGCFWPTGGKSSVHRSVRSEFDLRGTGKGFPRKSAIKSGTSTTPKLSEESMGLLG
jgi:hypothetical protein